MKICLILESGRTQDIKEVNDNSRIIIKEIVKTTYQNAILTTVYITISLKIRTTKFRLNRQSHIITQNFLVLHYFTNKLLFVLSVVVTDEKFPKNKYLNCR